MLTSFRFILPSNSEDLQYIDIDDDGDPDLLRYTIHDTIPVQWIDDDDDMTWGDLTGDLDNDCLMIDLNNNGEYGNGTDLIVDWNDENGDGVADIQAVLENGPDDYNGKWKSHFMYIINTDNKGIFNYINWDEYKMEGWERLGRCNFLSNYHGNSLMLKVHIASNDIEDIRYNWENPFLFYDNDNDGYSEMAIRLIDEPLQNTANEDDYSFRFSENITLAQLAFDLDNDNGPANELDYDLSLKFFGDGFSYSDQVHTYKSLKGLEGTEKYFHDPRFRQNSELIYCDHENAYDMIFKRGKWDGCWLVFDEDDDCNRWERVEFYEPLDPYLIGANNGGLDNNPQADVAGDRGEWDEDFSGEGNLYISKIDNRIHLLGAEKAYWRIDQFAQYYQGWQGWRGKNIQPEDHVLIEPDKAPIISYLDTDNNGFFDEIRLDMDADQSYEEVLSLFDFELSDSANVITTRDLSYQDFEEIFKEIAMKNWENGLSSMKVAKHLGLASAWYNALLKSNSLNEKYNNGFWLSYYIYQDLKVYCEFIHNSELLYQVQKAFISSNWNSLLSDLMIGHIPKN